MPTNQPRLAYQWQGGLYHPECLPENTNPQRMQLTPIFSLSQIQGSKRCVRCNTLVIDLTQDSDNQEIGEDE